MKKLKLLTLCLLIVTLLTSVMPISVFASPCCLLEIDNITQADGTITVDYWAINPLPNREVMVQIYTAESDNRIQVYEDYFYISADSLDSVDNPYTFDGTFLLEGYKYELSISYTYWCENEYCSLDRDSIEFTAQCGTPYYDYVDIPDGMLDLIGESTVAIKLTANAAGMYNFSLENEWDYDVKSYPQNYYVRTGVSYFESNESQIYLISTRDESDLSVKVEFGKADIVGADSETDNPNNNDVCFSLSKEIGLISINISKKGLYSFELQDKYGYNEFMLLGEKGERMGSGSVDNQIKEVLNPGVYYIDTTYLSEDYKLDIKYIVPDELKLNHFYFPEYTDERVDNYYLLKITEPTILTISNPTNMPCKIYLKDYADYYYGEETEVLTEGEYFVYFVNDVSVGAEVKFTGTPFESVSLDTAFTPDVSINNYYYYLAFRAPSDGKYEFDFTKYNRHYWFNNDEQDGAGLKYYVKEMKKDEWLLIGMYEEAEVTVREYVAPAVTELNFNETAYYDFVSGKEHIYSFTPSQDDLYKIYTENTYCSNIKIWTDKDILFETTENHYYSFNQNFEFKKDETVYISFSGSGSTYGEQSSVIVKSPYEEIDTGSSITVDNNSDVMVYYTAKESGYHNFNFSRGYGSSYSVVFTINDKEYYINNYRSTDALVYLEKDEKLFITFKKFNDNWLPDVSVTVTTIDVDEMLLDTSYAPSDKTYYSFTPESDGVYNITQPEGYWIDVRTDKSDYAAYGEGNDLRFVAKKGEAVLIYCYARTYTTNVPGPTYTDIKLTKVDTTNIDINTQVTSGEEAKIYTFYVPKTGLYRIENDLCNTRLDLYFNGEWSMITGVYSSLFMLEEGFNCIMATPANTDVDGIDKAYAKFIIKEAIDNKKINISIEDGIVSPLDGMLYLRFCITAPYDVCDLSIGIEYEASNGETVQSVIGYESMYGSDMRYTECELYSIGWNEGETHTIRPYVFIGDDEFNKIYGEEADVTFNLREDIIPLEYNTTKTILNPHNKYYTYNKDYWYEFTQPEGADANTYITYSDSFEYLDIFDEDYKYVSSFVDVDGNEYYELESGKKYYITLSSRYDDSDAEITISSLPVVTADEGEMIADAKVSGEALSFVTPENETEEDMLYAAVYDENGVLVEIITLDNPEGAYALSHSSGDKADSYKLMLLDKETKMPLCKEIRF